MVSNFSLLISVRVITMESQHISTQPSLGPHLCRVPFRLVASSDLRRGQWQGSTPWPQSLTEGGR